MKIRDILHYEGLSMVSFSGRRHISGPVDRLLCVLGGGLRVGLIVTAAAISIMIIMYSIALLWDRNLPRLLSFTTTEPLP